MLDPKDKSGPPKPGGPFNISPAFKALKESLNAKEKIYTLFIDALNGAFN